MTDMPATPSNSLIRIAVDLGPLLVFLGTYSLSGYVVDTEPLMVATGALMTATVIALTVSYIVERRIAPMPLITAAVLMVLGGLTLGLDNKQFVFMKPTFVNVLFASVLTAGILTGRNWMQFLFKEAVKLTDEGWSKLTWRWIGFFLALAALNEIVWRNFSEPFWVSFKVFGILPLTVVFTVLQIPLFRKYGEEMTGDGTKLSKPSEKTTPPQ